MIKYLLRSCLNRRKNTNINNNNNNVAEMHVIYAFIDKETQKKHIYRIFNMSALSYHLIHIHLLYNLEQNNMKKGLKKKITH